MTFFYNNKIQILIAGLILMSGCANIEKMCYNKGWNISFGRYHQDKKNHSLNKQKILIIDNSENYKNVDSTSKNVYLDSIASIIITEHSSLFQKKKNIKATIQLKHLVSNKNTISYDKLKEDKKSNSKKNKVERNALYAFVTNLVSILVYLSLFIISSSDAIIFVAIISFCLAVLSLFFAHKAFYNLNQLNNMLKGHSYAASAIYMSIKLIVIALWLLLIAFILA